MNRLLTGGLIVATLSFGACASEQTSKVPARAEAVASATGDASYRTADSGTLYVYDKTWDKLVWTGTVQRDQMVKVEPENSLVLVDGKPVVEQTPLGGGDQYQFFLDTSTPAAATTTVERRTVIEREVHE